MNRQQRRRSDALKAKGKTPAAPPTRVPDVNIEVKGLEALIAHLPDDRWYCLKVYFNRAGLTHISQQVNPVNGNPQP